MKELGPDPFEFDQPPKTTTRHIAYVTALPDDPAVFVADADGGNEERLTDHAELGGDPAWSPDGKRIAYTSDSEQGIFVLDLGGGAPDRLTRFGGSHPAWSPDGERILFIRHIDGARQIFTVGADGAGQRQLTHEGGADPVWSPGGDRIAFARGRDLYVMNADGGQARLTGRGGEVPAFARRYPDRLQPLRGRPAPSWMPMARAPAHPGGGSDPAWSPDGSGTTPRPGTCSWLNPTGPVGGDSPASRARGRIAFVSDRDAADGSNRRRIAPPGRRRDRLTYTRHISADVIVMDRDGSTRDRRPQRVPTQLVATAPVSPTARAATSIPWTGRRPPASPAGADGTRPRPTAPGSPS